MKIRILHCAMLAALAGPAFAAPGAPDPAQPRASTSAEHSIEHGSGTVANGGSMLGSSEGTTGGSTIGSGTDTTSTPGLAVDQGTVMRPLSAQGRNATRAPQPSRREQLYGLNPKADEGSATGNSTR